MAGRDRSAEISEYLDRNTAGQERIQQILTPMELITKIIIFFRDDLQYQMESLRITEELLDFLALNGARRSPRFDDKKRKGVMTDPGAQGCKSPRRESSTGRNPESGNPIPSVAQQGGQLNESMQNATRVPSFMVWKFSRGLKSRMLAAEAESISLLDKCIGNRILRETEKTYMKQKVEELRKKNKRRVQVLEQCLTEDERTEIIAEVQRFSVLSGYNINDYLFRAMEGDKQLLNCLCELSQKMLESLEIMQEN